MPAIPETQWIDATQFSGLLRPGMTVFVQGAAAEPLTLAAALRDRPQASEGVHYIGVLVPGINRIDYAGFHAAARATQFFPTPESRGSLESGRIDLVPTHYSAIYSRLRDVEKIDLAVVQLAPPDSRGLCSFGISADFPPAVLDSAKCIVGEINARMPALPGAPTLPMERLDYAVAADHPLIEIPSAVESGSDSAVTQAVAAIITGLVPNGACLQIGIGRLPAAVVAALANKNDLGLHSGLISDSILDLMESGVLTGQRKAIDRGLAVAGTALGSENLYQALAGRGDLRLHPVSYTHDLSNIAAIDDFMAINSVIEVDLSGQANAEAVGGRMISATGGLMDFARGAMASRGGRSILALPATAGGGRVSRIVPSLSQGIPVTMPRADADIVVTEHGVAHLRGLSLNGRAAALVAIAAPQFRDHLRDRWQEMQQHI